MHIIIRMYYICVRTHIQYSMSEREAKEDAEKNRLEAEARILSSCLLGT